MKALLYVVGLVVIGLAVGWFGFGIHPKTVYYNTIGSLTAASDGAAKHTDDLKDTGSRFVDVIKNNYNDQDMTQPMTH